MVIQENMSLMDKLTILSDAAKYDAACTSSGVNKKNNGKGIGNAKSCGICHSFGADGRCISLLKILLTNECVYNCKYCINRSSNDVVRATFTPEEVCQLTIEFYRRNYIEGLFLSSGILRNPDYTMQQMCQTVILLREKYHFGGYIHLKGIPGAHESIIEAAGRYADRMSVNLELPTEEGLKSLAPSKSYKNIFTPMRQIQRKIKENKQLAIPQDDGYWAYLEQSVLPSAGREQNYHLKEREIYKIQEDNKENKAQNLYKDDVSVSLQDFMKKPIQNNDFSQPSIQLPASCKKADFAPAGQSTQMIIGATKETDFDIIGTAQGLYREFDLKRVFYSAFINVNHEGELPEYEQGPPLLREHRLYQADWLMRFYGFEAKELLSKEKPNFNVLLDPKCDWALRHLEQFPIEINKAGYYSLLRVPGIGVKSAKRIIKARRTLNLDFVDLKKLGIVLKRAQYFITCKGKTMVPIVWNENSITNALIGEENRNVYELEHHDSYEQLSLFDDNSFNILPKAAKEISKGGWGQ